ncbi:hypothetical protein [Microbacterium sp.]|uniref:hypothetical protein n=1 Tax=Microbacterium sp. TaxID=51671 RepID=UPI0037358D3D
MQIRVIGGVGDLARDLRQIATQAPSDIHRVVRHGVRVGNALAKSNARSTAGAHGRHYHKAFSAEMKVNGLGGLHAGEYGPDSSKPQGGMSFEGGSRNQPPHNDLAKSADIVGPALYGEAKRLLDRWFWM